MRRSLLAGLFVAALALAGSASAAAPTPASWSMGLFAVTPGSTATTGIVRDAPTYGGITSAGPMCCEVTVAFDRVFNADVMRGSVAADVVVAGNPDETIWFGSLHGEITPEGSAGSFTAIEKEFAHGRLAATGRRFVGMWSSPGHADQSVPHVITLAIEGSFFGS